MSAEIRVQEAAFDPGAELSAFTPRAAAAGAGAMVSFTGLVRDLPGAGGLSRMVIEHYPGMTEKALEKIAAEAADRWPLGPVLILHRFGALTGQEPIMMVATASAHRVAAFEAAEFLMDYLKSRAPFWKKEETGDGTRWVAARSEDEDALGRWR
ncbi:molybdenum cofactor biosynthesis protein MoaE [Pseudooceanicola sp. CBS1P-1]|uniref:Molybdopterin synthase catalytic subunit n=1 Tax=Pseudooceanicola albus TaxID=2692189 RepID=A0A6L7G250_9RHOB|nr:MULTISPECIES: molybdenum cofactor biosynthesis protein MoaE [Pseudooceanicola]MBT9384871.1 molybdenum cofactor biosynthesis protein MoaE [Pseudooceanicola endophyticus]MXN18135.1 molybdenum cofactor biosynthesis protein MoaE [Pseudooceanicola albus]